MAGILDPNKRKQFVDAATGMGDVQRADAPERRLPILQQGYGSPEMDKMAELASVGSNPGSATPEEAQQMSQVMDAATTSGGIKKAGKESAKLAMDVASRMARAKEMGFDTPIWHGSPNKNIDEFKSNPKGTNKYLEGIYGAMLESGANQHQYTGDDGKIYELMTKNKNLLNLDDSSYMKALDKIGVEPVKYDYKYKYNPEMDAMTHMRFSVEKSGVKPGDVDAVLRKKLIDAGYHGVKTDNDQIINIFEPHNIRSTKAAFDPSKAKSGKILAGTAGAIGAGAALSPDAEAQSYADGGQVGDSVNVFNPQNELVSISATQLPEAIESGYTQASPEDVNQYSLQEKYGTPTQVAKTAAEAAARGISFGTSTGLETKLGIATPEDIRARREANPVASMAGEMTGLVGSSFIPWVGEANILNKVGRGAEAALGLSGTTALSKIGSAAVRGAVETAIVQGGDEASKMFSQDPNQSAETALLDIGLSGLMGGGIGGAFGVVSPLWKATTGGTLGQGLEAIQRRANGESIPLPKAIADAIGTSGVDVAPELRTAMSGHPEYGPMWQTLQESQTRPAQAAQKGLGQFYNDVSDNILNSVGKNADELPNLVNVSPHDVGSEIQTALKKDLELRAEPFKDFQKIKEKFSGVPLAEIDKSQMLDNIATKAQSEGHMVSPSSPQAMKINTIIKELPGLKTLEDLRLYQSNLWGQTAGNPDLFRVAGMTNKILRKAEGDILENAVGSKAPELTERLKFLREGYGQHADLIDTLNDRLKVGKFGGTESFINAMKEMKPEEILARLSRSNDVGAMDLLAKEFPTVAKQVQQYQLDKIFASAAAKAPKDQPFNLKTLFSAVDKMTPEMKQFVLPNGALEKINAARTLIDALPTIKSSWTARHLDSLWSKVPGAATALVSMMTGHNPVAGFLIGQTAKWVARDAPDAIRLSLLKFLGHSGPIEPQAFKTMVDFIHSNIKGETILNKSVKGLFKAGAEVLPRTKLPTERDNQRLDKKLKELNADSSSLIDTGGMLSHYLPEHTTGLASVSARAVQYLNSLRPSEDKMGILDPERQPSEAEKYEYNRVLSVAQMPLLALQHAKDGLITTQDVITVKTLYPALYSRMSQKIFNELTDHVSSGNDVPYKTRIGLSLFLGQPLDSTMTPQAIQSAQMANAGNNQQTQQQTPGQKGSPQSLKKLAGTYMTQTQKGDAKRATLG